MRPAFISIVLASVAVIAALASEKQKGGPKVFTVKSSAFVPDAPIPRKYAYKGEGENVSPPISWAGAPPGTKSFALVCDDPDAPRKEPWVHWVVYRIAASATGLSEGSVSAAAQGKNDFGEPGWGGPMPPKGHGTHHYRFKLRALDTELDLPEGKTRAQIEQAMKSHVLAEATLVGTYERK
jgi:Raf kinase inhibitor-like YbhB/YbcL family protein